MFLINGFVGASFGMLIFTSAIKSIPEELFRGQGGRRHGLADRPADHAAAPALADPLRADLPDDEPVFASYEYILLTTNGGWALHDRGLEPLGVPHGAEQLLRNLEFGYGRRWRRCWW